jgi:hypothetical protein
MSIAGYFGRASHAGSIRSKRGEQPDGLGIHTEGPVLQGEKTVEEVHATDAIGVGGEDREFYRGMADYDPVLRRHCRF